MGDVSRSTLSIKCLRQRSSGVTNKVISSNCSRKYQYQFIQYSRCALAECRDHEARNNKSNQPNWNDCQLHLNRTAIIAKQKKEMILSKISSKFATILTHRKCSMSWYWFSESNALNCCCCCWFPAAEGDALALGNWNDGAAGSDVWTFCPES
jgi:hypothetical protein